MALLHVAFQEGFDGDTVRVRAAGRIIYERDRITTRHQIGLADSADVALPDAQVELRVEVPSRTATKIIRADLTRPLFLAVSLTGRGDITHQVSHEPFKYA